VSHRTKLNEFLSLDSQRSVHARVEEAVERIVAGFGRGDERGCPAAARDVYVERRSFVGRHRVCVGIHVCHNYRRPGRHGRGRLVGEVPVAEADGRAVPEGVRLSTLHPAIPDSIATSVRAPIALSDLISHPSSTTHACVCPLCARACAKALRQP
jgi:hypothetical protein